ncbi:YncE family protein [Flavicella marina]|uniref:YncE family protein n=1 Tax=Flavicella marina TaxID=1475951 RepID=UPI00126552B1|nr:YncE family protein [Flavicella marina]
MSLVLISCNENDSDELKEILDRFENGIIVSAEGAWQAKDGSISFVSSDYSVASNFVYDGVNGAKLGGLIQSIAFNGENAYVVLNDVNTIVVMDRYTFKKKAIITEGLENPRYMAFANGKGYVTNWGDSNVITDEFVAVVDLELNKVTSSISVSNGPEQIVSKNNKIYVSNRGGTGYGTAFNNLISVIDASTNNITSTIEVKDAPDDLAFNSAGNLVVLSQGEETWAQDNEENWYVARESIGAIQTIDLSTNTVSISIEFADGVHPNLLDTDNGKIYYHIGYSGVYAIDEAAVELSQNAAITTENLYGMSVDNDKIYGVQYSFEALSKLFITDVNTSSTLYSTAVGLGASKVYFNE